MEENRLIDAMQQHMAALYRMAYSIVGNRADAEDAVQQALLNAWKARKAAREGRERAWLMRIVINECYTLLRRRRFQPHEYIEIPVFPQEDSGLREAVQALPQSLRTPFLLKYMEGLREAEVAKAMKLPVSSVKHRLFRARKQLKEWLSKEAEL